MSDLSWLAMWLVTLLAFTLFWVLGPRPTALCRECSGVVAGAREALGYIQSAAWSLPGTAPPEVTMSFLEAKAAGEAVASQADPYRGQGKARMGVLIPEPRRHAALHKVIQNAASRFPPHTPLVVMNGDEDFVRNGLEIENPGRLEVWPAPSMTVGAYSRMMLQPELYEAFPADYMLVLQTDAMVCDTPTKKMEHFFKWDYCGATFPAQDREKTEGHGRNGGFSLRSCAAFARVLREHPIEKEGRKWNGSLPAEDWYLARLAAQGHLSECPEASAALFSWESSIEGQEVVPQGVHKAYAYLDWGVVSRVCGGVKDLPKYQRTI